MILSETLKLAGLASMAGTVHHNPVVRFFRKLNRMIQNFTVTDIALLKLCLLTLGILTGFYFARHLRRFIVPVWVTFVATYSALMVRPSPA